MAVSAITLWSRKFPKLYIALFPLRLFMRLVARFTENLVNILDLVRFIANTDRDFAQRLLISLDPARVISIREFSSRVQGHFETKGPVAVVSGLESEPELYFLSEDLEVDFLRFDDNPFLFDLCGDWKGKRYSQFQGKYDYVLCSQVLEHVIDPRRAVENLLVLLKPGGRLHLNVPAINNRHDETYFYAGFSVEVIGEWLRTAGFDHVEVLSWNSDKGARMYATCDWSPLAVSGPLIFYFQALATLAPNWRSVARISKLRFIHGWKYIGQSLFASRPTNNAVMVAAYAQTET